MVYSELGGKRQNQHQQQCQFLLNIGRRGSSIDASQEQPPRISMSNLDVGSVIRSSSLIGESSVSCWFNDIPWFEDHSYTIDSWLDFIISSLYRYQQYFDPKRLANLIMKNTGVVLEQFTLFPKLPTELRLKIWRFCCPSDRVVTLRPFGTDDWRAYHWWDHHLSLIDWNGDFHPFPAEYTIPTVFQICKESRYESMKTYQHFLGALLRNRPFPFDFSRDTLIIVDY